MLSTSTILSTLSSLAAAKPFGPLQKDTVVEYLQSTAMATTGERVSVPGNNEATFCTVSREKQLFDVDSRHVFTHGLVNVPNRGCAAGWSLAVLFQDETMA